MLICPVRLPDTANRRMRSQRRSLLLCIIIRSTHPNYCARIFFVPKLSDGSLSLSVILDINIKKKNVEFLKKSKIN